MIANTQFGYKSGLSAIDAIIKIEHAIQTGPGSAKIVLMGLSKAFDIVSRLILRTTIFTTGHPLKIAQRIAARLQKTTLRCKDNSTYGPPVFNNIGVFQGSALIALLFAIYLDDVMLDYQAPYGEQLPHRTTIQPAPNMHANKPITQIENATKHIPGELQNKKKSLKHDP